jgi:hypothetical protein
MNNQASYLISFLEFKGFKFIESDWDTTLVKQVDSPFGQESCRAG